MAANSFAQAAGYTVDLVYPSSFILGQTPLQMQWAAVVAGAPRGPLTDTFVYCDLGCGNGIFSPTVHVPLNKVATVAIVPTYIGQAPEAVTQLLVRDVRGRRLFRMRGNFWHAADLRAVADALPVRATVVEEPMPIGESLDGSPSWAG